MNGTGMYRKEREDIKEINEQRKEPSINNLNWLQVTINI